jgi:hypothetical protein
MEKKDIILKKFTYLLESIAEDRKVQLAAELAKMIPVSPESEMDWSVGWGYFPDKNEVSSGISLKISPCQEAKANFQLIELIEIALMNGNEKQLLMLEEALDRLIDHAIPPYRITFLPSCYLTEDMSAIHFTIKGIATDYVQNTIFKEKLKFVKKQHDGQEKKK